MSSTGTYRLSGQVFPMKTTRDKPTSRSEQGAAVDRLQLARAVSLRLQLRHRVAPVKSALRLKMRQNGIRSALINQRVGNAAWGRMMAAKKGGLALKRLRPSHYRDIGRLGVAARRQFEHFTDRKPTRERESGHRKETLWPALARNSHNLPCRSST